MTNLQHRSLKPTNRKWDICTKENYMETEQNQTESRIRLMRFGRITFPVRSWQRHFLMYATALYLQQGSSKTYCRTKCYLKRTCSASLPSECVVDLASGIHLQTNLAPRLSIGRRGVEKQKTQV